MFRQKTHHPTLNLTSRSTSGTPAGEEGIPMKYLIAASLLLTTTSQADSLTCKTVDGQVEVRAQMDLERKKVEKMTYLKKGKSFKEFRELKFLVTDEKNFEVVFNSADYYYLELEEKESPDQGAREFSGVFITKNSPLSIERSLSCELVD
jgi:hypothetical protein